MRNVQRFAVAAAVCALAWLAAGCGGAKCGPSNCTGCCDSSGLCEVGNVTNACGANGAACKSCSLSQTCELGQCATITPQCTPSNCNGCCNGNQCVTVCPTGSFCGPAGTCLQSGDGGSCGPTNCSGCCLGNTCVPVASESNGACGSNPSAGSACVSCSNGQTCSGGVCSGGNSCNASNCAGCCAGNTCVLVANETTSQCGSSVAHGAACVACGGAQSCSGGVCTTSATCTAANCAGCCAGNTCVLVASETTSQCGSTAAHGATCIACGAGQSCTGGTCTGGTQCSPLNCTGCCAGNNCVPVANETTSQCGSGFQGLACVACTGGQSCTGGVCVSPTCSSSNCSGCCSGTTCIAVANESNSECGTNGAVCSACGTGLSCQSGVCSGTCNSSNCSGCCSGANCIAVTNETTSQCGSGGAVCVACPGGDSCTQGVCQPPTKTVSTLAGTGVAGFNDGAGTSAQFDGPGGLALDFSGFLYVADESNARVRMVDVNTGDVATLAGSGDAGFADGPGATAMFNTPSRLAFSGSVVYVSDSLNDRIRAVQFDGTVSTVAGNGVAAFLDGPAASAEFDEPYGVAANGSTLYVSDELNNRIRRISAGTVATFAGSGVAGFLNGQGTAAEFSSPGGIAVDTLGNLYVSDSTNNRIRKIDSAGNVTTLAGTGVAGFADGPGASAQFDEPRGIAVDGTGTVYVADELNNRIRKIDPQGNVTTVAGNGTAGFADGAAATAEFNAPAGVAVDASGTVYVGDTTGQRIRVIK